MWGKFKWRYWFLVRPPLLEADQSCWYNSRQYYMVLIGRWISTFLLWSVAVICSIVDHKMIDKWQNGKWRTINFRGKVRDILKLRFHHKPCDFQQKISARKYGFCLNRNILFLGPTLEWSKVSLLIYEDKKFDSSLLYLLEFKHFQYLVIRYFPIKSNQNIPLFNDWWFFYCYLPKRK